MVDLRRTYGCKMRDSISGKVATSSGLAHLILSAEKTPNEETATTTRAQLLHTNSQVVGLDFGQQQQQPSLDPEGGVEWRLLLPCGIRQVPVGGQLRWLFQAARSSQSSSAVPLEQWAAANGVALSTQAGFDHQVAPINATPSNLQRARLGPEAALMRQSRIIVASTHLALEWPRRLHRGRYICQLLLADTSKTMCDINVIIRQPMRLSMEAQLGQVGRSWPTATSAEDSYANMAALSTLQSPPGGQRSWLPNWFGRSSSQTRVESASRKRRQLDATRSNNPLLDEDPSRIQVSGKGLIRAPPIARVGGRLELECRGIGEPIDSIKWFRDGQAINTQSSSDFQVQIVDHLEADSSRVDSNNQLRLLSSLTINHLQAKDVGLSMFECFGSNLLGDRARAGLAVLVAESSQIEWARSVCPNASEGGVDEQSELEWAESSARLWPLRAHNPFARALALEAEPLELSCPASAHTSSGQSANWTLSFNWQRWTTGE